MGMNLIVLKLALGAYIKNRRKVLGLTQEQFAKRIGISHITLNKLELGKIDPKLSVLYKVSNELEMSLINLFQNIQEKNWSDHQNMSDGDKTLKIMEKLDSLGKLPAHWKEIEEFFVAEYNYKPKDYNQVLADLSHPEHCNNYPSIGKPVFKRVKRGTYQLL